MEGWKRSASGGVLPTKVRTKRVFVSGMVFCSVVLVLCLSLYPFTFEQFDRILHLPQYFSGVTFPTYTRCCTHLAVLEPLANIVLYLPLGFGLTGLLGHTTKQRLGTLARVLLLSVGLSLVIEVLQVFQPWRSPSLADVLMNSIGGGLGGLCYLAGRAVRNAFRPTTPA